MYRFRLKSRKFPDILKFMLNLKFTDKNMNQHFEVKLNQHKVKQKNIIQAAYW